MGKIACAIFGLALTSFAICAQETAEPKASDLLERSSSRLAQIDITALGTPEALASLTAENFTISVRVPTSARPIRITDFSFDRLCGAPEPGREEQTAAVGQPPGHYLLYFDQPYLTMEGRMRSIELARDIVSAIADNAGQAMLISNAGALEVVQPLSSQKTQLLDALDRLEHDRTQWDMYAEQESSRVAEVARALDELEDVSYAVSIARRHHREETWRVGRDLRRLKTSLTQLVDLAAPRVVIYFSDTMRSNPGEHYLTFFGQSLINSNPMLDRMKLGSYGQSNSFDAVVNEASALGIRFYTVQARGLVSYFDTSSPGAFGLSRGGAVPQSPRLRLSHAQQTLQNLAAETGGSAFIRGAPGERIAQRLLSDASCVFLASFDPVDLPEDRALPLKVTVDRKDVELRVRGRLIVQSESEQTRSRLTHAFTTPGNIEEDIVLATHVVPTGFDGGRYQALVQLVVPEQPLHGATWDLGSSAIFNDRVHAESSGRVRVSAPGVAVVLESEMEFKPGQHSVVSVAHESGSGWLGADEVAVEWPNPNGSAITLTPIALLQPAPGIFVRDEKTRSDGSIARGSTDRVFGDRPTALIGLVCRDRRGGGLFAVERRLIGSAAVEFPPLRIDLTEDRCAQIRDLIPAGSMGPGHYRYEISVSRDDEPLGRLEREFSVGEALDEVEQPTLPQENSTPLVPAR